MIKKEEKIILHFLFTSLNLQDFNKKTKFNVHSFTSFFSRNNILNFFLPLIHLIVTVYARMEIKVPIYDNVQIES